MTEKLISAIQAKISSDKERFVRLNSKMVVLNPMSVLSRGYGAVFDSDNNVIKCISQVEINDNITVEMQDGRITATVLEKERRATDGKKGS